MTEPDILLRQLLERNPVARVAALSPDGSPKPVPDDLAIGMGQLRIMSPGLAGYRPEDRPGILAAFDRALSHGVGEAVARALNAPEVWLTVHLLNMTATHQVILSVSVVVDAKGSSDGFTELPSIPPRVGRIKKGPTAAIIDIDQAITSILGWSAEDVIGKRSLEFIHPDDHHLAIENWLRLRANPDIDVRARLRHKAADGSWLWFEVSQTNLLNTDEACVVAEMIDISAEMAAQEALAAREQLLHQLTQTLPLGIFQIDRQGSLVYTNDRLFDIVGQRHVDNVQRLFAHAIPQSQQSLPAAIEAVLGGADARSAELRFASACSEHVQTCRVVLRPLTDSTMRTIGAVGCVDDVTESVAMRRELEDRATYDSLTGCHNRQAVLAELDRNLTGMDPGGAGTGVIFIDLDRFKAVNDNFGHAAGNELLTDTVTRLRAAVNRRATVGRIGGDEFLIVMPDLESAAVARRFANDVALALRTEVTIGDHAFACTASVGVAWTNDAALSADQLVAEADHEMYVMKREHRGLAIPRHSQPLPRTRGTPTSRRGEAAQAATTGLER